jgi:hypothetical protein
MKLTVILPSELKEKSKMFLFLIKVVGFSATVAVIICGWGLIGSIVVPRLDVPHAVSACAILIIIVTAVFNLYWVGSLMAKDAKDSYGK